MTGQEKAIGKAGRLSRGTSPSGRALMVVAAVTMLAAPADLRAQRQRREVYLQADALVTGRRLHSFRAAGETVNVILGDFRALDTLVETVVVILAALGVGGLLLRERSGRETSPKPSFVVRQLTRLILPLAVMLSLALLLKGHDAPGGGFVSGLSLAIAAILGFAAYGTRSFRARIPARLSVLLLGRRARPRPRWARARG